jgi:hypothetical protein
LAVRHVYDQKGSLPGIAPGREPIFLLDSAWGARSEFGVFRSPRGGEVG